MAFATNADVQTRQGRTLTSAESDAVDYLLDIATAVIAQAADKDDTWAAALTPVPTIIRGLTVELVSRALDNPTGLSSLQEQIGSYQYTKSFNRGLPSGLVLTDIERQIIRRTIGSVNYSSRTPTYTETYLENLVS